MTKRCRLGGILKGMQRQKLLLLTHLLILYYVDFSVDAGLLDNAPRTPLGAPVASPLVRWRLVAHSWIAPEPSGPLLLTSILPAYKGHRKHLLFRRRMLSPAQAPNYGSLVAVGHPSLSSSHISTASLKQNQHSAPSPDLMHPPTLEAAPPGRGDGSMSPGSAEAPVPPSTSGCCGLNMVQRRGSLDCHCVYPIHVELYLWNVSLSSNWRDEFLNELASQLNLQVSQFEIDNFYVVGTSGLNITMDITPHTGLSFSASKAYAVCIALTSHSVRIDPTLVGSYKLLNLTYFKPPASSLAPASAASPNSPPPLSSPLYNRTAKEASSSKHANIILVLGICAGAVIVIITSMISICYCKSNRGKKAMSEEIAKTRSIDAVSVEGSLAHPSSTRFLAYEELREATNNFESSSMLGEGGFGRVFRGVLSDGTAVAIKKLTTGGNQGDKEFLVEVQMLSRLHHRNLVKLVGYYSSRDSSQNLLCYELVPNGSLEAWLHGPLGANCPLDWDTRMKIALDAARGLAYLHEDSQPCVIHRDFKASNILLENDFHAKVADFGLAKQAPEGRANYLSTRVMGTFGYVAPEYAMTGHLLVKSDVYSYGVVLLELLTGKKPVDMSQPSGQENLVNWARPILRDKEQIDDLADSRLAGKYPKDDFVRVCTIAAACVAPEAAQRPTMGEVVQSLKMVQRTTEYQDSTSTNVTARPNVRPSLTTYESDGVSSMFSSGPFSGLSLLDNDNISKTAMFSEDLHEGR